MKNILLFLFVIIPSMILSQQINIVTFNIRLNTPTDGQNAWPNRVDMVTGLLKFHEADIFGMQEALIGQIEDIQKNMPDYEWFGVGRDDGKRAGEFSPIFFRKAEFVLLDHGTFWLSETPEKPGKGWDAAFNRVVTWGKFQSKASGKQFLVFNTHFDHIGVEARKNSAILIRNTIDERIQHQNLPVILTGDFNLTPDEEPISLIKQFMNDSREVSEEPPYGPVGTFNGFDINADLSSKRIDYVFTHGNIKVLKYATLTDFNDHRFPSDHLPVFTAIELQ
jgi:endonuclease/exonuclease/phosphatase family metal-dependent hydrolase